MEKSKKSVLKKFTNNRRISLTVILAIIFLITLLRVDFKGGVLHTGGYTTLKAMATSLIKPDLSLQIIILAIKSCWQTFAYALISISVALVIAFPMAIVSSGVIFKNKAIMFTSKALIGFLRAVHELIWAWIFVAAVGLNPIGAVFALAIPYAGYFGKIFADLLEETPKFPIIALQSTGANKFQVLVYGYLPAVIPNMFSYVMYRLECATRSSSVLSFVGLGGIGFQIQISLQDLKYNQVWTFMAFLIILIVIIDKWGYEIRRRIK